jgi:DNA-binding GntR family transcriptional regulator
VEWTLASGTTALDLAATLDTPRAPGLRDGVVLSIERAVLNGAVAPGQRLVEAEIARQMGISKAPVREALRELERLGLVVSYPRRGTFVAEVTPAMAGEAYSLRAVLESYAGRLAVARYEEADLQRMEDLLVEGDAIPTGADHIIARAELDLAFHDEIYRLSGHRQLQEAWGNLRARVRVLMVATGIVQDQDADVGVGAPGPYRRWHAPILNALRTRDADRTEAAIIRHLAGAERGLVKHLGGDGVDGAPAVLRVEAEARERCPHLLTYLGHVSATNGVAEHGST